MKADGNNYKQNGNGKGKAVQKAVSVRDLINADYVKERFQEVLKDKAPAFLASVASATTLKRQLAECDPTSVISAAMVAATLDLPIDPNLGFAAIIPYRQKNGPPLGQFQIMYKGFIQLAMRTGQYQEINVSEVYEDELISFDPIKGKPIIKYTPGGQRDNEQQNKIVGYAAYFKLSNGFEHTEYWSVARIDAHGKRYSKSYDKQYSPWQTNREAMRAKTVLKMCLSKWGILSTTMQTAMKTDQAAIRDVTKSLDDDENINYVDAEEKAPPKPEETEPVESEQTADEPEQAEQEETEEEIDIPPTYARSGEEELEMF